MKDVDDIIYLITILDERKLLSHLPCYVVNNTDSIPSLKLEDGDLKYLFRKFDRFEEALTHLQACFNRLHDSGESRLTAAGVSGVSKSNSACNSKTSQPVKLASFASVNASSSNSGLQNLNDNAIIDGMSASINKPTWAERLKNGSVDQLPTSDMETDNNSEFKEVIDSRRKKRRIHRSPPTNTNTSAINDQQSTGKKVNSRQPLIIGRLGTSESSSSIVAAAKPLLNKEVFCIDNVDTALNADDLVQFVKSMNVRVISCYETRPRRTMRQRRNNEFPDDRKAFRLCIVKDDRSNLLVADNWPTNITVSSWFFKGQSVDTSAGRHTSTDANDANDPDKTVLLTVIDNEGNGVK